LSVSTAVLVLLYYFKFYFTGLLAGAGTFAGAVVSAGVTGFAGTTAGALLEVFIFGALGAFFFPRLMANSDTPVYTLAP
jgi:hypothetical protein